MSNRPPIEPLNKNNSVRLVGYLLQQTLPDAVYSQYSGTFDNASFGSYVSAVLCHEPARVRILDLFGCDEVTLESDALIEELERLAAFSRHDHMDMICVRPDALPAILPLVNHANEACHHRVGFVTDEKRIDEYRPCSPSEPQTSSSDPSAGGTEPPASAKPEASSVKARLSQAMEKAKALGIDLDDEEPTPAADAAEPDFEAELASAPGQVAESYARICSVLSANTGWPEDEHYNLVLEECVGESATSTTFQPALMAMVKTGQLTAYLGPLFEELLAKQHNPEQANQALLKISRVLLLYTRVVPERVRQYVL